jgi:quercetin dioxygenase-like cupin family protein
MEKVSLIELAQQHLEVAKQASSGRSAHTVYGGHAYSLRQTLIALAAGSKLNDHESPGEATLYVLQGRVRLTSANGDADGVLGDHLEIPEVRHGLEAVDDCVVLLTVAKTI